MVVLMTLKLKAEHMYELMAVFGKMKPVNTHYHQTYWHSIGGYTPVECPVCHYDYPIYTGNTCSEACAKILKNRNVKQSSLSVRSRGI